MNQIIERMFIQEADSKDKHGDNGDSAGNGNSGNNDSGGDSSNSTAQKSGELPNRYVYLRCHLYPFIYKNMESGGWSIPVPGCQKCESVKTP